ncbi:MAG: hypothetical protein WBE37_05565 [Bryobacteraceae bacterium]
MKNVAIAVMLMVVPAVAGAQWLHYPSPGTPRSKDGKPDLAAAAPRTADGKPDLSGIWEPEPASIPELLRLLPDAAKGVTPPLGSEPITKYFLTVFADFKPGEEPLQPQVVRRSEITASVGSKDDPFLRCFPLGMPIFDTYPSPRKIVQTPGLILMLNENDTDFRQIFTDGRKLPEDPQPSWLGYSVGTWEGDTLVVDTAGFNDRGWLDSDGHTHSEDLHLTERFHRLNFGRMELQLTLDDPKTFTKPFTIKFNFVLFPDTDLMEQYCAENEKDLRHIKTQ